MLQHLFGGARRRRRGGEFAVRSCVSRRLHQEMAEEESFLSTLPIRDAHGIERERFQRIISFFSLFLYTNHIYAYGYT